MKKLLIFLNILLSISLFFPVSAAATPDRENGSHCSGFYGQISTDNWPGGSITISCEGDGGPYCSGDQKTITLENGRSTPYNLDNCSCGEFVPTGLIKIVTRLPATCAMATDLSQYVAQNGWDRGADFGIGCSSQATPTPQPTNTPVPTRTPTPTPRPNSTPTPTITPTPPNSCVAPGLVPNVRVSCPTCQ